jgi:hypothetical protein
MLLVLRMALHNLATWPLLSCERLAGRRISEISRAAASAAPITVHTAAQRNQIEDTLADWLAIVRPPIIAIHNGTLLVIRYPNGDEMLSRSQESDHHGTIDSMHGNERANLR